MSGRKKSPDPKVIGLIYVPPSETRGTHLAHWPPPRFEHETSPIMMKHAKSEPANRAKPHGWKLTRAIFSEFADEEE